VTFSIVVDEHAEVGQRFLNIEARKKKESDKRRSQRERNQQALEPPPAFTAGNMLKFVQEAMKVRINPSRGWTLDPKTSFPKAKPVRGKVPTEMKSSLVGRLSDDVPDLKKEHKDEHGVHYYNRTGEEVRVVIQAGSPGWGYKDSYGTAVGQNAIIFSSQFDTPAKRLKEIETLTDLFNAETIKLDRLYQNEMRAWRKEVRMFEAGVLKREWTRGNFVIFRDGTTGEMIEDAIKQLHEDNDAEASGGFADDYQGRIPVIKYALKRRIDEPLDEEEGEEEAEEQGQGIEARLAKRKTRKSGLGSAEKQAQKAKIQQLKAQTKATNAAAKDATAQNRKQKKVDALEQKLEKMQSQARKAEQHLQNVRSGTATDRPRNTSKALATKYKLEDKVKAHTSRLEKTREWNHKSQKDKKAHLGQYKKLARAAIQAKTELVLPHELKTPEPDPDIVHRNCRTLAIGHWKLHHERCKLNKSWRELKTADKNQAAQSYIEIVTKALMDKGTFNHDNDLPEQFRTPSPDPVADPVADPVEDPIPLGT
jgi:hypothetical protein